MIGNLRNILLHVTGSLAFLVLPFLFSPDGSRMGLAALRVVPMQRDFLIYLLLLGVFYLFYFVLIPKLYFPKKYLLFILAVIACYIVVSATPRLLIPDRSIQEESIRRPQMEAPERNMNIPPPPDHLIDPRHLFLFCFVISLALVLQISNRWKRTEKEKLQAEVAFLKAQINPHFLFNMLNTIYALALDRSEHTADAVVKLSDLMRHVINESGNDLVDLGQEIDHIINYVELQRIRFDNAVQLDVRVSGEPEGRQIVPLLLIPVVENAFRHGFNPDEPSDIRIHIAIEQSTLRIDVYNRKVTTINSDAGLGLKSIRDRLQLLYPGKHLLTVRDTAEDFLISLTLQVK